MQEQAEEAKGTMEMLLWAGQQQSRHHVTQHVAVGKPSCPRLPLPPPPLPSPMATIGITIKGDELIHQGVA